MKPDFALSLSFDAVTLLFRQGSGWMRVGDVPVSTEDLTTELAILRSKAQEINGGALRSKLVIPDDQIRYLTIETGRKSHQARLEAAATALEGATPYPVHDLAFDISADGPRTHIAAVAIETLHEAEDFAQEHGFGPVSFAAAPDQGHFASEPFFGTARAARGLTIEPDTQIVEEIGLPAPQEEPAPAGTAPSEAVLPPAPPYEATSPEPPSAVVADDKAPPADVSAHISQVAEPQQDAPQDQEAQDHSPAIDTAPTTSSLLTLPPAPPLISPQAAPERGPEMSTYEGAQQPKVAASSHLVLANDDPLSATEGEAMSNDEELEPTVSFSTRRRIDPFVVEATANARPVLLHSPRLQLSVPSDVGDASDGANSMAPSMAPSIEDAAQKNTPAPTISTEHAATHSSEALPSAPKLVMPTLSHTTSAPPKHLAPSPSNGPVAQHLGGAHATLDKALDHVPQANFMRPRPQVLGLMAVCIAAGVAIGAWTLSQELPKLWSDLKRADLIEGEDQVPPPVILRVPVEATSNLAGAPFTPPDSTNADAAPDAPNADPVPRQSQPRSLNAPQGLAPSDTPLPPPQSGLAEDRLSGTDAAVLSALGTPAQDDLALLTSQELVIASLPAPARLPRPGDMMQDSLDTEPGDVISDQDRKEAAPLDPEALADGISAPASNAARNADVDIGALEQAARYAATGIWQSPPGISDTPAPIHFEEIYVASIDHTNLSQDAVALPDVNGIKTDGSVGRISSPIEAGRQFQLDSRGLVTATTEGTMNPDGIMVFAGRAQPYPPATPARPSASDTQAAEKAQRDILLAQVRPRLRPANLLEQAERAQLGGLSRAELTALRPKARPDSLKTPEQESQPATSRAVAVAQSPRARPSNFANIVDRARSTAANRATSSGTATAAAAPASRSRQIPSSASVARQATVQGALNLRRLNLIGVTGSPSERRAFVRLPSGRIVEMKVGDRIDGGNVIAIGESQLQYQKGGRNHSLTMPKG